MNLDRNFLEQIKQDMYIEKREFFYSRVSRVSERQKFASHGL